MKLSIVLWIFALFALTFCDSNKDPYKILGVSPTSSNDQIKRAYKQLAKEWHPDKNPNPEAAARFVDINQAYEILSDPEKRSKYDRFGSYEATEMPEGGQNSFANFHFGNFGGFQFNMHSEQTFFTKHRISFRMYDSLLQQSHEKPFLIFVYADWCLSCMRAEPIWERIVSDLEPIGYGIGTVNNMLDSNLVDKLRVRRLPGIVALIDGRAIHYDEQHIDVKTVVQFARTVIPPHHVTSVNDYGYAGFLQNAFGRNKVAVLMFGHQDKPRIRYMLAALKFHAYCSFGYVQLTSFDVQLREMYDLKISQESLLVFHENPQVPVASLQMKEIPSYSMLSTLETYKFLSLPRISSQRHFDELCPPSGARANRKLCAILVVRVADDSVHVASFRDYAETRGKMLRTSYGRGGSLRFLYIYEDKQSPFIETLVGSAKRDGSTAATVSSDSARNVIVVWRPASDRAQFDWLTSVWDGRPEFVNRSIDIMERRLEKILKNNDVDLVNSANLKAILDENGPSLYKKLASKIMRSVETISHQLSKEEVLPIVSVFGTLFAIMFVGWCLNLAVESEKKTEKEVTARKNRGKTFEETDEYKSLIHELRAETYFGMVRLLKPGCRTLVVLTDKDTKAVLVPQFARAIWPWRKNRTLMFGFVMVEKNLEWFRCLLEHALPDARSLNINPRNVVGTVLALNGFRQHFSMYHPKHAPSLVGFKGTCDAQSQQANSRQASTRSFLGFDSEHDEDESSEDETNTKAAKEFLKKKQLRVDELLEGLPNWLERLFEGLIRKYSVSEWPPIR